MHQPYKLPYVSDELLDFLKYAYSATAIVRNAHAMSDNDAVRYGICQGMVALINHLENIHLDNKDDREE